MNQRLGWAFRQLYPVVSARTLLCLLKGSCSRWPGAVPWVVTGWEDARCGCSPGDSLSLAGCASQLGLPPEFQREQLVISPTLLLPAHRREEGRGWGVGRGAGKTASGPFFFFFFGSDTFSIVYQAMTMQQNPRAQSSLPFSLSGLSDSPEASISQALN